MTKLTKELAYIAYLLFLILVAYLFYAGYRGYQLYSYVKANKKMMSFGVYETEPTLGYAPRRGSQGRMLYELPPDVPVFYDQERNRVSAAAGSVDKKRPLLLALGDSYTHGDAVKAEEAFPYIVASQLEGTVINRGFSGYSLAQMVLLARQLIPIYKPDYVLLQYTPWLINRGTYYYAITYFGKLPQPFFYQDNKDQISIAAPFSDSQLFKKPVSAYRDYPRSIGDFLSFYTQTGLPFFFDGDIVSGKLFFKKYLTRSLSKPANDHAKIIQAAYGEVAALCEAYNCKLVIDIVGYPVSGVPLPEEVELLQKIPNAIIADTWTAQLNALEVKSGRNFILQYTHFRGNPPRHIDPHPNPKAHTIMANEIVRVIKAQFLGK